MNLYVEPNEATIHSLVLAKQLVMTGNYPQVQVFKFITITKSIIITLTASTAIPGSVLESWGFVDSEIKLPTVVEDAAQQPK